MKPVATGGRTSGSVTSVSSSVFPGKRPRASSHASATPGGSISAVAASATSTVKRMMSQVLGRHGACERHAEAVSRERRRAPPARAATPATRARPPGAARG